MPSCSTRSSRHFFSLPSAVPPGPVAMKSGLMPKGSRAQNNSRSAVSQIANANMPRSRCSASGPQKWYAARIASPSPSVANTAPCSAASVSLSSR
ncbi:Uncharacterised protein [Mycobacteroides abscessus subsp. abscessus]|nr:Uncharacterised protein [Mycobacteroides abscessus subsp. abscessus]